MKTWQEKSLPLQLAILAFLTLSCGTTRSISHEAVARSSDHEAEAVQVQAREVMDQIRGTVAQRAAAEFLIYKAENDPTASCMAKNGYSWQQGLKDVQSPALIEPFTDTVWLREPMYPAASNQLLLNAGMDQAIAQIEAPDNTLDPGENLVLNNCIAATNQVAPSDEELSHQFGYSTNVAALDREFRDLVDEVDSKLGSANEYSTCMKNAGTDPSDPLGHGTVGYSAVRLRLELDGRDAGVTPGSPAWSRFLEAEKSTLDDDRTCRKDQYPAGMALLSPALEQFKVDHAEALLETEHRWETIAQAADDAGHVDNQVWTSLPLSPQ